MLTRSRNLPYNDQEALHDAVARAPEMAVALTGGNIGDCAFPNADWASQVKVTRKTYMASCVGGVFALIQTMLPFGDLAASVGSLDAPLEQSLHGCVWYSTLQADSDYDLSSLYMWRPVGCCARLAPTQNLQYRAGVIAALPYAQVPTAVVLTSVAQLMTQPDVTSHPFDNGIHVTVPHGPMHTSIASGVLYSGAGPAYAARFIDPDATAFEYTPVVYDWDPEMFRVIPSRLAGDNTSLQGYGAMNCVDPHDPETRLRIINGLSLVPRSVIVVSGLQNDTAALTGVFGELTVTRVDEFVNSGLLIQQKPITFAQKAVPITGRPQQAVQTSAGELILNGASQIVQDNWRSAASLAMQGVGLGANLLGDLGIPGAGLVGRGANFLAGLF